MSVRALILVGLLALSTSALAEPRPRLQGVSAARIANYNAPSVLFETRDEVRAVVEDLNELRRRKDWQRGEAKVACYSTVVLTSGKKRLGEFRVTPEAIVERPVEKGQSSYSLVIGPGDLPRLARMLADILPAKDCN